MFAFSCTSCGSEDPVTSTVKVNLEDIAAQRQLKEEAVRREEDKRREQERLEKEAEWRAEEARRAEERAQALVQREMKEAQEAEARRVSEDLARRVKEEEARRAKKAEEQQAKEEEREQRERVAAEEERLRKEHERRVQQSQRRREGFIVTIEEDERKKQVTAFLQKHGFKAVDAKKSGLMSSTYALHKAAEAGDEKMIAMLLKEGANPIQENSSGKTAAQVAEKRDKAGSHAKVLEELRGARNKTGVRGGA